MNALQLTKGQDRPTTATAVPDWGQLLGYFIEVIGMY